MMKCPGCQAVMRTISYEGISIETCPKCNGEWLDDGELKSIVDKREVFFSPEEVKQISESVVVTGVPLDSVDRDLVCPKCDGTTDAINYGGDTGIIIDRCTSCRGVWLDCGELERIQQVVEGWEASMPEDVKRHAGKLNQVAETVDTRDDVSITRIPLLNMMINGFLDLIPGTR